MSYIDTYDLRHSTVFSIYSEKDDILVNPEYQRNGGIWTKEKKQLLIDSILNRYDIPKLYFHKFDREKVRKSGRKYSIIDGRQRLETIWEFIDGGFALAPDIQYLRDESVQIKDMTYSDLGKHYPKIKNRFDATDLPIVVVETDDIELIEDMFSRLNEAVPLNAAEKRNALGGDVIRAVNSIAASSFFRSKVKFSDNRYQHREVAIRLLYLVYCQTVLNKIIDTKKVYLDRFAKDFRDGHTTKVKAWKKGVMDGLASMTARFSNKDPLLQAQAAVPVYFLAEKELSEIQEEKRFSRSRILAFNKEREKNRKAAAEDIVEANFELLEFDRMSQQGTNDASSIRERVRILVDFLRS